MKPPQGVEEKRLLAHFLPDKRGIEGGLKRQIMRKSRFCFSRAENRPDSVGDLRSRLTGVFDLSRLMFRQGIEE
jgi:hypothetical protein